MHIILNLSQLCTLSLPDRRAATGLLHSAETPPLSFSALSSAEETKRQQLLLLPVVIEQVRW